MAEQVPQIAVDPVPAEEQAMKVPEQQQKTISHEPKAIDPDHYRVYSQPPQKRAAAGPQIWAVVLTIGGLYYIWTRVLGKRKYILWCCMNILCEH